MNEHPNDFRGYEYDWEPHDIYGLSTDTKPLDVPNGSMFIEMDTSDRYLFHRDSGTWYIYSPA